MTSISEPSRVYSSQLTAEIHREGPLNNLVRDIRALEIDDATGDIYAAAWGFGIYKLANGSSDWEQVNNGLTNLIVNSITIDSEGRMFAGTFGGGIFMSDDGGNSWTTTSMEYNMVLDSGSNKYRRDICSNLR